MGKVNDDYGYVILQNPGMPFNSTLTGLLLDREGEKVADVSFSFPFPIYVRGVLLEDEKIYMSGYSNSFGSEFSFELILVEADISGEIYDLNIIDSFSSSLSISLGYPEIHMAKDDNENIYVSNFYDGHVSPFLSQKSPKILKIDSLGNLIWTFVFEDYNQQFIHSLKVLSNNDLLLSGFSGTGSFEIEPILGAGGWIVRFSPEGDKLYERIIQDRNTPDFIESFFGDIIELENRDLLVTGLVRIHDTVFITDDLVSLMRLGPNGCLTDQCDSYDVSPLIQEFAPVDGNWHFQDYSDKCIADNLLELQSTRDTFLDDRHARVVQAYKNKNPVSISEIILYEEDERIYFYEDSKYRLIYDFQLLPGDTLKFSLPSDRIEYSIHCEEGLENISPDEVFYVLVDEISWEILDNDRQYKKLHTSPILNENGNSYDLGIIMQQVGSEWGFGGRSVDDCISEGCVGHFRCYGDDDIFYKTAIEECDLLLPNENTLKEIGVIFFPNPANESITISSEDERIIKLSVIDIAGTQHIVYTPNEREVQINTSHLPGGVYIINIVLEGNKSGYSRLIKL